jgi:hypothetical protein
MLTSFVFSIFSFLPSYLISEDNMREILYYFFYMGGWNPYWVHSALRPLLAYCTWPVWLWRWRSWWNERFWQGKPKYSENTCPDATLSTTNPTCQTRARTGGRRGGKPATSPFSYGAAISLLLGLLSKFQARPPRKLARYVMLRICILEVTGSNLVLDMEYPDWDFPSFS